MAVLRWCIIPIALATGACATYGDWVSGMEQFIARGQPDEALAVLAKRHSSKHDAVLDMLNKAMLLRMDGRYAQSTDVFEAAKPLIERLSVTSVTEQTGALTVNDTMRSYTGDPYERVMLHVYEALNYLEMGQPDNARIEALQLDVQLNSMADDGYHEDAFARYLTGMIYEALHEWDNAMIAYRKAYEIYRKYPPQLAMTVPGYLKRDLLRSAQRLGLENELGEYQHEFGRLTDTSGNAGKDGGELIFFLHSGLAPVKHDVISSAVTESGQVVSIALPVYASRTPHIVAASVHADDRDAATQLVENIDTLAIESLNKQMPAITARAIARAVVKSKAVRETRKNDDSLGFLVNLAGVVSERADTRSWSTLPNRIYIARLPLPAGHYNLSVDLMNNAGDIVQRKAYNDVVIEAGEKRFLSLHKVLPADLVLPEGLSRRRRQL